MKTAIALLVLASCSITASPSHNSPVEEHRASAVACPATVGDEYGPDECAVDSDCPTGSSQDLACACAGTTFEHGRKTRNLCVNAGCHVDADCGVGGLCSPSPGDCANRFFGIQDFQCRTPNDTCGADVDCVTNGVTGACAFMPQVGHWACAVSSCAG